jgi:hypothetical protein
MRFEVFASHGFPDLKPKAGVNSFGLSFCLSRQCCRFGFQQAALPFWQNQLLEPVFLCNIAQKLQ